MIPDGYLSPEGLAAINARREQIEASLKAKREQRKREAEGRALAQQMGGWTESAMGELVEIYKGLQ